MLVWNCVHYSKQILGDISANPCRRSHCYSNHSSKLIFTNLCSNFCRWIFNHSLDYSCKNANIKLLPETEPFCVRGYISKATVLDIVAVWSPKNSASHLKRERRSNYYLFKPLHIILAQSTPSTAALLLIRAGVPCPVLNLDAAVGSQIGACRQGSQQLLLLDSLLQRCKSKTHTSHRKRSRIPNQK